MRPVSLRCLVIGLDSFDPWLFSQVLRHHMPTLAAVADRGRMQPLRATDPPVTVPSWISMTTGKSPGELGLYGFASGRDPVKPVFPDATWVRHPRIWDVAAAAGLRSAVVGVPLTTPLRPSRLVWATADFLHRSGPLYSSPAVARALSHMAYAVDVEDFRSLDRAALVARCTALTRQRFAAMRALLRAHDPHFAMVVDMAPDRLHHGALRGVDPRHPAYAEDPAVLAYYRRLDQEIAALLDAIPPDAAVFVVSDHGIQPLRGAYCLNDALVAGKFLRVRSQDPGRRPAPVAAVMDGAHSRAWARGGYVGKVYRMPGAPESVLDAIADWLPQWGLRADPPVAVDVVRPHQWYDAVTGDPPDLFVVVEDLRVRCAGTVGHGAAVIPVNDTGADDANHDWYGLCIAPGQVALPPSPRVQDLFFAWMRVLDLPQ